MKLYIVNYTERTMFTQENKFATFNTREEAEAFNAIRIKKEGKEYGKYGLVVKEANTGKIIEVEPKTVEEYVEAINARN